LRGWLAERADEPGAPLFPTSRGGPMSTDALQQRLTVHAVAAARTCPDLAGMKITPHVLRHYVDGRVMWPAAASPLVAEPRVLVPAT
jgi:integrase